MNIGYVSLIRTNPVVTEEKYYTGLLIGLANWCLLYMCYLCYTFLSDIVELYKVDFFSLPLLA